ncbi:hypothetical protein ACQ4M3_21805 [Leptolyngbya sp. AN03gr2]|uniref:hypothetical protein n=1 Tax=unclassified Leptolyngbya TaxID=2650499 RepID=UPI003D312576
MKRQESPWLQPGEYVNRKLGSGNRCACERWTHHPGCGNLNRIRVNALPSDVGVTWD